MNELPAGTVTFLFTDIEGSTQLWEKYPDKMRTALAQHDAILRDVIASNHGQSIKTTGDGVHAVFEKSHNTASWAAEALRERANNTMTILEQDEYTKAVARLRTMFAESDFNAFWAEGRALTMEQAIELALSNT